MYEAGDFEASKPEFAKMIPGVTELFLQLPISEDFIQFVGMCKSPLTKRNVLMLLIRNFQCVRRCQKILEKSDVLLFERRIRRNLYIT